MTSARRITPVFAELAQLVGVVLRQMLFTSAQLPQFSKSSAYPASMATTIWAELQDSITPDIIMIEILRINADHAKCSVSVNRNESDILANEIDARNMLQALSAEFGVELAADIDTDADLMFQLPLSALLFCPSR